MHRNRLIILGVVLVSMSLVACTGPQPAAPTQTSPAVGNPGVPTWTPPPLPVDPNGTLSPTLHVPDSLTTAEVELRLSTLAPDGDCALPCYVGMIPGQGGVQDALDFYARLGISGLDLVPGDYEATLDGTGHLTASLIRASDIIAATSKGYRPPKVDVYIESNVTRYVYVQWDGYPPTMPVQQVLQVHGMPEQVQLGLVLDRNPAVFIVQLLYVAKKTGFAYLGNVSSGTDGFLVCVNDQTIATTLLGVFGPDLELMGGQSYVPYLRSVDQALGLGIPDAATILSTGGCIGIPPDRVTQWQAAP
jgi:hypothetical protein